MTTDIKKQKLNKKAELDDVETIKKELEAIFKRIDELEKLYWR